MVDFNSKTQVTVTNTVQNPPKQFTYTLTANGQQKIEYDHNFFRVLSLTGTGLQIRFGNSGTPTDLVGAGIGVEHPEVINSVQLFNTSGANITITVIMGIGKIFDDRLNVSGAIDINSSAALPIFINSAIGNGSITRGNATTTATQITGVITGQRFVRIKNIGFVDIFLGLSPALTVANGYPLTPNEEIILDMWSNHIFVICAAGTAPYALWTGRA